MDCINLCVVISLILSNIKDLIFNIICSTVQDEQKMLNQTWGMPSHTETVRKVYTNMCLKWPHFEAVTLLNFGIFEDGGLSSIPFAFAVTVQMYCLFPWVSMCLVPCKCSCQLVFYVPWVDQYESKIVLYWWWRQINCTKAEMAHTFCMCFGTWQNERSTLSLPRMVPQSEDPRKEHAEQVFFIIRFVRLLALRPLLAYCASLGW
jgi:hypothetical protein